MPFDVAQFFATVAGSAALVGVSVLAAARTVGSKWLDSRFAGKLEESRQAHASDLERLKFERADVLDRAAKLNQREFEVLPDIWAKTTDAHYSTSNLIAVFQEHADVGAMSEPQFDAFIERSKLEEWQRAEIRAKDRFGRTTYYGDALRWIRLNDANQALIAFNSAMLKGAIFVHPETYARFEEVSTAMNKAFHYFRINMQSGDDFREPANREEDPIDLYRSDGSKRYEALGKYLRERYWINAKGEAV